MIDGLPKMHRIPVEFFERAIARVVGNRSQLMFHMPLKGGMLGKFDNQPTEAITTTGVGSTFLDINKLEHRFPESLKTLGLPVTLLHQHNHAHGSLVFSEDFLTSTYCDDVASYYPCSWYTRWNLKNLLNMI